MEKWTLQEALELCMEHWNYIGEYGDIPYGKHSQVVKFMIGNLVCSSGCAACAFANDNDIECCDCIMPWSGGGDCLGTSSEFCAWINSPTKQNALKIAYLAEAELDRHGL